MSFLVNIVFLACVLVVNAKPLTEQEKQAMYADLFAKCKSEEGASDSDVQEMQAHEPPSTRQGQCLHACMMENVGLIQNGKLSIEGSIKFAEMSGDPAKIKNAEAVGKECQSVTGSDRCDTVNQIMQCVGNTSAALGLDPKKDLM